MSERFELSFKNVEVRVWCYIMLPLAIAGILVLLFAEYQHHYIASLLALIGWITFFIWRFLHKKKTKIDSSKRS